VSEDDVICLDHIALVTDEWMNTEYLWNDTDRGKARYLEKIRPSATISTTYLTWTNHESNLGLCGER